MKKNIISLVTILAALVITFFAYSNYSWAKKVIKNYQKEGYVVAETERSAIGITAPWTYIIKPVTKILFYDPDSIEQTDDNYLIAKIIRVDKEVSSNRIQPPMLRIFDCQNKKSAFYGVPVIPGVMNFSDLVWNSLEEGTIKTICDFD